MLDAATLICSRVGDAPLTLTLTAPASTPSDAASRALIAASTLGVYSLADPPTATS